MLLHHPQSSLYKVLYAVDNGMERIVFMPQLGSAVACSRMLTGSMCWYGLQDARRV